jgi:cysteine-rich repeat protein
VIRDLRILIMYVNSRSSPMTCVSIRRVVLAIACFYPLVSANGQGQLVGTNPSYFLELDIETGEATEASERGLGAIKDLIALAYDPIEDKLYSVESGVVQGSAVLISIDPSTGVATTVGPLGPGFSIILGLAYDTNTSTLYGIDLVGPVLITIDTTTGEGTFGGVIGFQAFPLAFDPNSDTLYSVTSDDDLISINPGTGAGTVVGATGIPGYLPLAFDPNTDTLFANDQSQLFTINTATGAGTAVGPLGLFVGAMAFDAGNDTLYGFGDYEQVVTINPATGAVTVVAPWGLSSVIGLAVDQNTGTLYGTTENDQLITIEAATGDGTAVGLLGFSSVQGLAFDPNSNTLYGSDISTDQLITIDPATGVGTAVGPLGFLFVSGLAFDRNTNTLYGVDGSTDQLITIDPATGAGTAVGPLGFSSVQGLAFDPDTNTLYGTRIPSGPLITIDQATGAGTLIGPTVLSNIKGLAFIPPDPPPSCGDGILDAGEECDDGNMITTDTCTMFCRLNCGCTTTPCVDCDGNGTLDTCDLIACSPGDVACEDCNLNGIPDACDIVSGASLDTDLDGIPDECVVSNANGDWTDDIWDLDGASPYPDNGTGVPDLSVEVQNSVALDVDVETRTVIVSEGGELTAGGGSNRTLTVTEPGGIRNEGVIENGIDGLIDALASLFLMQSGGEYRSPDGVFSTGILLADLAYLLPGTESSPTTMELTGAMEAIVDVLTAGSVDDPPMKDPPGEPISIVISISQDAQLIVNVNFSIGAEVSLTFDSSQPAQLGGDFENFGTTSNNFSWSGGIIFGGAGSSLASTASANDSQIVATAGPTLHQFEVAGRDLGPDGQGYFDNFAIGSIEVDGMHHVTFVDEFDNDGLGQDQPEALYVETLILRDGSTITLQDVPLFYLTLVDEGGTIITIGDDATVEEATPPIPTATTWGLVIVALFLLTSGTIVFRNRLSSVAVQ